MCFRLWMCATIDFIYYFFVKFSTNFWNFLRILCFFFVKGFICQNEPVLLSSETIMIGCWLHRTLPTFSLSMNGCCHRLIKGHHKAIKPRGTMRCWVGRLTERRWPACARAGRLIQHLSWSLHDIPTWTVGR